MSPSVFVLSLWLATGASTPTPGAAPDATAPAREAWWGLDGSEPGPHSVRTQGSASGAGVRSTPGLQLEARPLLDATGAPVLASVDYTGVHVIRFQQGAWTDLPFGKSAQREKNGLPLPSMPAVALDGKGRILVAWVENPVRGPARLRLFREKGGGWDDLTPASQPAAPWCTGTGWNPEFGAMTGPPTVAIDGAGQVVTLCRVFHETPRPPEEPRMFPEPRPEHSALEAQRWDGKRWRK